MKNETNIYDIDGNIIRKAGDNHKFTLSEVEKLVDDLTEKVRQNPDNQVYKVYLNNAQRWLYNMYNNMTTEELKSRLTILQDTIKNNAAEEAERERKNLDELNRTIDKFKEQYDNKPDTTPVLESDDKPVVMDEYVEPIEEIA